MKRFKKIGIVIICLAIIISLFSAYYISKNWVYRYEDELDQFFGEGNWEYLSKETKESSFLKEHYYSSRNSVRTGSVPGKYNNWYIRFNDVYGDEEICLISDHPWKINNEKRWIFSSKRYSKKQALYLELMHISFEIAGKKVFNEIIKSELSENEANTIVVDISYRGGNPKPKFYNSLSKEPWFTVDQVTAEHYLTYELHDFYIDVFAYDYRLDQLTKQERQNVLDSLEIIEKRILEKYGDNASFKIYFDKEHQVEYIDGTKQELRKY